MPRRTAPAGNNEINDRRRSSTVATSIRTVLGAASCTSRGMRLCAERGFFLGVFISYRRSSCTSKIFSCGGGRPLLGELLLRKEKILFLCGRCHSPQGSPNQMHRPVCVVFNAKQATPHFQLQEFEEQGGQLQLICPHHTHARARACTRAPTHAHMHQYISNNCTLTRMLAHVHQRKNEEFNPHADPLTLGDPLQTALNLTGSMRHWAFRALLQTSGPSSW